MKDHAEVVIIGGGPAGAAAGILLARQKRKAILIEKTSTVHDKVCGEFLSGEALLYLARLGTDLKKLGALPVYGVRLVRRKCIAECDLPFSAMSLTRRKLDEELLAVATREGVEVRRGVGVDRLERLPSSWIAQMAGSDTVCARTAFLATGKHDLRGWRRPSGNQNNLVAFKMYFALCVSQRDALQGWIELYLFPGGYAGLQLTEDGNANLCLLVNRKALRQSRSDWHTLLSNLLRFSQHLAERLEGARPLLNKPLALSSIPYGLLLRNAEPNLWRLGDQAAVTPSFSGDGMSIALHSAELASELYLDGGTAQEYAARLYSNLREPIAAATAVSRLMIAAPALSHLLPVWPRFLSLLAEHTRVPQEALVD